MSFLPLSSPTPTHSNRPPILLPSPLPVLPTEPPTYEAPTQEVPPERPPSADHHDDSPSLLPPANFSPFFTLLSSTHNPTTHHPAVHYVFSDDSPDTDPITAAALRTLGSEAGNSKERYVLLDMDPTGTKVLSAQSMSPDWAVTSTELGPAPTWDGGEQVQTGEQEGRGLMLRIEGMEAMSDTSRGRDEGERNLLEDLVESYEKKIGELKRVVDAGVWQGRARERD